jgi:hypothetical protein
VHLNGSIYRNECVIDRRYTSRNPGEDDVNNQVDSFSVSGQAHEWRIMPWRGAVLIVEELNEAIDAQEFDMIMPQPDGSALDFCFGERIFRVVLRAGAPSSAWSSGRRIETPDVLLVLSRLDR